MAGVASASFPPAASPAVPHDRDPAAARMLTAAVAAALAVLVASRSDSLVETVSSEWPALLFWILLVFVVDLFPVVRGPLRFTLDMPLLLSVALLYPPEVAAVLAFVAAIDLRELRHQIPLSRALFNRSQVALAVFLAAVVFRALGGQLGPWPGAIVTAVAVLGADYLVNVGLVVVRKRVEKGARLGRIVRHLWVGGPGQFFVTYLGYGLLGLLMARLFVELGAWSVVIFLVPLLVARQLMMKIQQQETLAQRLRMQKGLLEGVLASVVDERKDERRRIAGELHDDVLQSLGELHRLIALLAKERNQQAGDSDLAELMTTSSMAIRSLRAVIRDLGASPLSRGGLLPTLRSLVTDLRLESGTDIVCVVPARVAIPSVSEVLVYQVLREALLNAVKHSRAGKIQLALTEKSGGLSAVVSDDGVGFSQREVDEESHFGLGLMRERVARMGGVLEIASRRGRGTRSEMWVPGHNPTA